MNTNFEQLPKSKPNANRDQQLLLLIGVCCIGFFIADVATPACFHTPFLGMLALGVVTAQLTVICVWGTLVRGTFWIRLPWTLLLLVVSWCALALGVSIENGRSNTDEILGVGLFWMIGFITSFVPLKIAALCFRWQIIHDSAAYQNEGQEDYKYAIRDIMIGTLLLALALAIGRAMLAGEEISFARAMRAANLNQAEPFIALTIFGIVSLLVKLPCIWISLGEKTENIKSRICGWAAYCFALAIAEIIALTVFLGPAGPEAAELFAGIILSHQLMGAIMLGVCLTLRGLGYRLERSVSSEHGRQDATD